MKKQQNSAPSMAREIKGNKNNPKMSRDDAKKFLERQRSEENEMVKGIFKFYEVPGGQLSFAYRKHKGEPVENYTMVDGQVYTIPLGVARHLNNNGWYPVHSYTKSDDGEAPAVRIGQKVHRFGFQSLDFVDVSEMQADIVTVEHV